MIKFRHKGNFTKLTRYLERAKEAVRLGDLDRYGREGVAALASVTPIDSGQTASSWYYKIENKNGVASITFYNSNVQKNFSQSKFTPFFMVRFINQLFTQAIHTHIQLRAQSSTTLQLIGYVPCVCKSFFIAQLMLKTCPTVHCNGAELYFHAHIALACLQVNGDLNNQVQATVAILLWVGNVVFLFNERNVILL